MAGTLATGAMSALMMGARRSGLMGQMPPEKITSRALDAAGFWRRHPQVQDLLATALHFAFGGGAGAMFAVGSRQVNPPLPPAIQGMLWGTAVWGVSYLGWVPALGIMPPATRDRPGRAMTMLSAHWLYGAVLGQLLAATVKPARRVSAPAPA